MTYKFALGVLLCNKYIVDLVITSKELFLSGFETSTIPNHKHYQSAVYLNVICLIAIQSGIIESEVIKGKSNDKNKLLHVRLINALNAYFWMSYLYF